MPESLLISKEKSLPRREAVSEGQCAYSAERAQIERVMQGDAEAAREIVRQHQPGMYALALRVVRDPAEAEDLVQDSFARAFGRLDQFDANYRLSTWLYRITLNSCRDYLKSPRRKEQPASAGSESAHDPAEPTADIMHVYERTARVHRALGELRPKDQEIILLKDLMERSYEEIRDLTGSSITGLKIRAIRARARLRKLLEDE